MQIPMPHLDSMEPNAAQHLLWDVLDTIAPPGEDTPEQRQTRDRAGATMLEAFCPVGLPELMAAVQIVGLHHMAMACLRWAMQTDPVSAGAARLRRDGIGSSREMRAAMRDLREVQQERVARGPQTGGAPARGASAEAPADAQLPEPTPPADAPASEPAPPAETGATIHEFSHRERGATDWSTTPVAMHGIMARHPRRLTDAELGARMKATAPPDGPREPPRQEAAAPPPTSRWEDLASDERVVRFGYRREEGPAAENDKQDG